MNLYDELIRKMGGAFDGKAPARYPYNSAKTWQDTGHNELVMLRDAAFELGGNNLPTVNCTCVTTTPDLIPEDEILVYGKDLQELRGDASFVRLAFLDIEDIGEDVDEEQAYNAIKKLEFVRYNVHPAGYMVRVSTESNQEQVRVSKAAVSKGITFEKIGNAYISKYKEIPGVKHVRIIFATGLSDLSEWKAGAKKTDEITRTLTHILDGINFDCGSCNFKEVCDDTPGLKEAHIRQREDLKRRLGIKEKR